MRRPLIFFLISVSLLEACKRNGDEKVVREVLFFRDNGIKMQPDTISVSSKQAIENGKYTLNDEYGKIISEGKFNDGFREGEWVYHPTDTTTIAIDWSKYVNDSSKIEINYPKNWEVIEDPDRPFQASWPLKADENSKGKYFIILYHNKDSIHLDLYGYQRYYKSQVFETEKVKEYAHFLFETVSGRKFYFMRYIVQRQEEELSIFTFVGDNGSEIYDITYSSLNERNEEKHIIFFDIIRSFRLNGKWFFSPYDPIKDYKRFEYQDQPKTTT
jgi:hypothetical protein